MSQKSARQRSLASAPDHEQAQELLERSRDPGRVMALTDGIFAIIMTLLVLDIHVPQLSAGESLKTAFLLDVWPNVVVFVISFVLTGLYWVAHRDMFNLVRGVDRGLVWLNILFMLPVALVPAAAALLGAYSHDQLALRILRPALRADSAYATRVMVLYRHKASPAHRACRSADVVDWCFHIDSPDSGLPHRHTRRRLCAVPESRHIRWCASALLHRDHPPAKVSPKGVT